MRTQLILAGVVSAAVVIVGSGSSKVMASPAASQSATVLTSYFEDAIPDPTQDFVESFWGDSEYLFKPVFGDAEPWVAKGLTRVDALTWRIELRSNVKFQNGHAVNAAAVAAWLRYEVANDQYAAGAIGQPTKIRTAGPLAVLVKTKAPFGSFRHGLANSALPVTDVAVLKQFGKNFGKVAGAGIYTGPFSLTSAKPGVRQFVRNPNYWHGKVALKGITLRKLTDPQSGLRAVQAGEADILLNPPPKSAVAARGNSKLVFKVAPRSVQIVAAVPNARIAPFDDVRVRKALALALDNTAIAKSATFGIFPPLKGLFPPGTPYSFDWKRFNVNEARQILEGAGWKDVGGIREKDGKKLTVTLYAYSDLLEATATAMTDTLHQVGFDAKVERSASYSDFAQAIHTQGGVAVINAETYGFDGNPVTSMGVNYLEATYQSGPSFTSPPDKRIINLINSLLRNQNRTKLERGMRQLGKLNAEGAFYIPIMEQSNTLLVGKAYRALVPNPFFLFLDQNTAPRT